MVGIMPEKHTYELINRENEFGINIPTTEQTALVRTYRGRTTPAGADATIEAGCEVDWACG